MCRGLLILHHFGKERKKWSIDTIGMLLDMSVFSLLKRFLLYLLCSPFRCDIRKIKKLFIYVAVRVRKMSLATSLHRSDMSTLRH